jgi:DNA-binding NarL/FixJ family response regulator
MERLGANRICGQLSRIFPGVPFIILASESAIGGFRAIQSGTVSVVSKDAPDSELYRAIRTVKNGSRYLSPEVAERATDFSVETQTSPGLTARQQEILRLVAEGYATKEIANKLGLSPRTVDSHCWRIMERLGVRHLAGLVQYPIRTGLIAPSYFPAQK